MNSALLIYLLPAAFILVGIGLVIYAFKLIAEAKAGLKWPAVEGTIIDSNIGSKVEAPPRNTRAPGGSTTINLASLALGAQPSNYTYRPEVVYEYTIDGVKHLGDRIGASNSYGGSRIAAVKTLARYPKDAKVKVYYNPENPDHSLLEPGTRASDWTKILYGLIFFAVGVAILVTLLTKLPPPH